MKLISVKCPECNAAVKVGPDAVTITCEYCGTQAQVQRRSGPRHGPGPRSAAAPTQDPQIAQLPIAREYVPLMGKILFLMIPLFIVVPMGLVSVLCALDCLEHREEEQRMRAPRWGAGGVLVQDLNRDKVWDVVGYVSFVEPERAVKLTAINGATGETLWLSPSLGDRGSPEQTPQGVLGNVLVRTDGGAELTGLSLSDGKILWRTRLDEKITQICGGDAEGTLQALTADGKLHPVVVADGALKGTRSGPCRQALHLDPNQHRPDRQVVLFNNEYQGYTLEHWNQGMVADRALYRPAAGVFIGLGHKQPGTKVPMIAAYSWPEGAPDPAQLLTSPDPLKLGDQLARQMRQVEPAVKWQASVPGVDPLSVETEDLGPEHLDFNDEMVVVAYKQLKPESTWRLTAFHLADGKRAWDICLGTDDSLHAVVVTPTHAVVSISLALKVVDLKTGKLAHQQVLEGKN